MTSAPTTGKRRWSKQTTSGEAGSRSPTCSSARQDISAALSGRSPSPPRLGRRRPWSAGPQLARQRGRDRHRRALPRAQPARPAQGRSCGTVGAVSWTGPAGRDRRDEAKLAVGGCSLIQAGGEARLRVRTCPRPGVESTYETELDEG